MNSLTILGRGSSWKECPFDTQELWASASCLCTPGMSDKNYTRVFAFDDENVPILQDAMKIAKDRNIPLVSSLPYATQPYPLMDIVKHFKINFTKNTVSYMMALALYEGYKKFYMYGIDQGPGWLLQSGKPWVTFWLGVATGMGVDVRMGRGCLRWTYRTAPDGLPEEFLEREMSKPNASQVREHYGDVG